jgi:AraC family transcriptional regulator of adaptative response / DNA-3-methyladenine glycosylase II
MIDLAMASGFSSLRRFNDTFKKMFHRSPSELRRHGRTRKGSGSSPQIRLFLSYHPPYDWERILAHLKARAIEGVEEVTDEKYRRAICLQEVVGIVEVSNNPTKGGLDVMIQFPALRRLSTIIHRLRMLFDVYADTNIIDTHLSSDPLMAKLVAQHPGLRVPGSWDGFELTVRAILGQQVTVRAAQKLAAKLVQICHGPPINIQGESLIYAFPSPSQFAFAPIQELGMPEARKNTLRAMANAVAADPNFFDTSISLEETVRRLRSIPGVGEWTAQYIALRAFRETDAFPATDSSEVSRDSRVIR